MKKSIVLLLFTASCSFTALCQSQTPDICFANIRNNGTGNRSTILSNPELTDKNRACRIQSFEISFYPKSGDMIGPFKIKGNRLTDKETAIINKLAPPVKIQMDNIKCIELSSGMMRSLPPLSFVYDR